MSSVNNNFYDADNMLTTDVIRNYWCKYWKTDESSCNPDDVNFYYHETQHCKCIFSSWLLLIKLSFFLFCKNTVDNTYKNQNKY